MKLSANTPIEVSREEFDQRLTAANVQRSTQLDAVEAHQTRVEQLLSIYERTLDKMEIELTAGETLRYPTRLRRRLTELAEKTALVAASV